MKSFRFTVAVLCLFSVILSNAQTVKDREGAILGDRAKMAGNERWIYNDVDRAFEQARKSGRPLMVVLRCVPCLACMGLDTEVLLENRELKPLLDQFIKVRVINANSLDLSKFQFDYDLSFSVMFFNGDGTIYGRYGSWEHQHDSQNRATGSLQQALAGALSLHRGYPGNKSSLSGKQGEPLKYKTPIAMPTLLGKFRSELNWNGKVVQSCVHCHQIGDAIRVSHRSQGKELPSKWVYPHPAPAVIGLQMSHEQATELASVIDGSPADQAGIRKGDRIVSMMGQQIISTADISWALNNAPDAGMLSLVTRRDGGNTIRSLTLPEGWRSKSDISKRVGTWPMRRMAFGGMLLADLTDAERKKRGLGTEGMALFAKHVGQYGKHAFAKRQGFMKGDVITSIDGRSERISESELIGTMITKYQSGRKVPATVLRGKRRMNLKIPVQ